MSLEHLRLVAREGCAVCDGTGGQPSEDWASFEKWAARRGLTGPEDEENVEQFFLEVCGYEAVPPMREPCEPCNGTGSVDVEVQVGDLLELVYEFVQRPLIAAGELDEVVDHIKRSMTAAAMKSEGLADSLDAGSWLRVCQEAAEALRAIGELRPRRRDQ